jgi:hypothetical protein
LSSFIGILQVLHVTSIPSLQGSHYRFGAFLLASILDEFSGPAHMTGTRLSRLKVQDEPPINRQRGLPPYFFNPAVQFSTSVIGRSLRRDRAEEAAVLTDAEPGVSEREALIKERLWRTGFEISLRPG